MGSVVFSIHLSSPRDFLITLYKFIHLVYLHYCGVLSGFANKRAQNDFADNALKRENSDLLCKSVLFSCFKPRKSENLNRFRKGQFLRPRGT